MVNPREFSPDWVCAPGDTIRDLLQKQGRSEDVFARELNQTQATVRDLLSGEKEIDPELANALVRTLGATPEFWLSRESRYRNSIALRAEREATWVMELPTEDMERFGWIPPLPGGRASFDALLKYFAVPNLSQWARRYGALETAISFRTSPTFDSHPAAVAAWLRQGEIEASKIDCAPWNREGLLSSLPAIRALTRQRHPEHFLPKLTALFAANGVAFVVVRAPEGCRASGGARFSSPDRAIVQLSFRYLSDDHFWFTVFHEIGHLVIHGDRALFLEGVDVGSAREEEEANAFAAQSLIPVDLQPRMRALRANTTAVLRFASDIGIAAGVVVGQLQHAGILQRNQLNGLKRRFAWGPESNQPKKRT